MTASTRLKFDAQLKMKARLHVFRAGDMLVLATCSPPSGSILHTKS